MITKEQAKIGVRVKWKSLDDTIPVTFGSIVMITSKGEAVILCDEPNDDGTCDSSTWLDSSASCWHLV